MKLLRRIWHRLLREPMEHISVGDLPEGFTDAIITHVTLSFGWRARIGILLGCQVEVKGITYCEQRPGKLQTKTGLWIFNPTQPPSGLLGAAEPPQLAQNTTTDSQAGYAVPAPPAKWMRYTCPECGSSVTHKEETGITRRQIDCPHCEYEGTVDGKDVGYPIVVKDGDMLHSFSKGDGMNLEVQV